MTPNKKRNELGRNVVIVVASVLVALLLDAGGAFDGVISGNENAKLISAFVAGIFFTSFITTAPAILALGKIAAASSSIVPIALAGGLGALIGDIIIFYFLRETIVSDAREIICHPKSRRIAGICTGRIFRFLTPVMGALIIASPIPDEVGLSLLGVSNVRLSVLVPISYVMNTIGILAIGFIAQSI